MPHTRRALLPFAALSASYFAHIGFFNPYLPLWLQHLGLPLVTISALLALQASSRLFAPYLWGWLSDRTGERVRWLRWGAGAALLSAFALWAPLPPWGLGVVLLLMFSATSAMMPMSEAAMAHLVSAGGAFDARRYGRVRLWGSAGFMASVLAAGLWFESRGLGDFVAWVVLSLAAVLASAWALPDLRETPATSAQAPVALSRVLAQAPVRWFFVSVFFHVLSHMGIYVFFSLYLDSLGYSKALIGVLWAVSVLAEIAWFFWQSRWLHWLPLSGWLLLCSAVMVLRMGLTATWPNTLAVLLLAQTLHALTFAAHHTACIALLSHHFPGRLRGRGQALFTTIAYGIPGVMGALLGGWMSAQWGLASVFVAGVLTSVVAVGAGWRVWRLHHPPEALA